MRISSVSHPILLSLYLFAPRRFLESEADLDEEIKNMATLSADPSLYPYLITLNAIDSIVSLLAHENSDISLAAIELLNTLTDQKDNIDEEEDGGGLDADAVKGVSLLIRHMVKEEEKF